MGIEKDIHQTNFRNEYQKMGLNLIFTVNWLNEHISKILAKEDITQQQYNILRILKGAEGPLSTLQIRCRMLDRMSDTSRIVDRLLLKGFVEKSACTKDKRLVDIVISKKGRALLDSLEVLNNEFDALFANVTEKEAQTLNAILDKIRTTPTEK